MRCPGSGTRVYICGLTKMPGVHVDCPECGRRIGATSTPIRRNLPRHINDRFPRRGWYHRVPDHKHQETSS